MARTKQTARKSTEMASKKPLIKWTKLNDSISSDENSDSEAENVSDAVSPVDHAYFNSQMLVLIVFGKGENSVGSVRRLEKALVKFHSCAIPEEKKISAYTQLECHFNQVYCTNNRLPDKISTQKQAKRIFIELLCKLFSRVCQECDIAADEKFKLGYLSGAEHQSSIMEDRGLPFNISRLTKYHADVDFEILEKEAVAYAQVYKFPLCYYFEGIDLTEGGIKFNSAKPNAKFAKPMKKIQRKMERLQQYLVVDTEKEDVENQEVLLITDSEKSDEPAKATVSKNPVESVSTGKNRPKASANPLKRRIVDVKAKKATQAHVLRAKNTALAQLAKSAKKSIMALSRSAAAPQKSSRAPQKPLPTLSRSVAAEIRKDLEDCVQQLTSRCKPAPTPTPIIDVPTEAKKRKADIHTATTSESDPKLLKISPPVESISKKVCPPPDMQFLENSKNPENGKDDVPKVPETSEKSTSSNRALFLSHLEERLSKPTPSISLRRSLAAIQKDSTALNAHISCISGFLKFLHEKFGDHMGRGFVSTKQEWEEIVSAYARLSVELSNANRWIDICQKKMSGCDPANVYLEVSSIFQKFNYFTEFERNCMAILDEFNRLMSVIEEVSKNLNQVPSLKTSLNFVGELDIQDLLIFPAIVDALNDEMKDFVVETSVNFSLMPVLSKINETFSEVQQARAME